jgi:head-tail adaptor
MGAGKYRSRISVLSPSTTTDSFGQLETEWTEIYYIRASVTALDGRELEDNEQVKGLTTYKILCRYAPLIKTNCKICVIEAIDEPTMMAVRLGQATLEKQDTLNVVKTLQAISVTSDERKRETKITAIETQ